MEHILKSSSLESAKSGFLISLLKSNENGKPYVSIRQTVIATNNVQKINIHPFILSEIIELLIQYKNEIETIMPIMQPARRYLTEEKSNNSKYIRKQVQAARAKNSSGTNAEIEKRKKIFEKAFKKAQQKSNGLQ